MSGGRIAVLVTGVVLALVGFGAAIGGAGMLFANTQRDADGYLASPTYELETAGYALVAPAVHLGAPTPADALRFNPPASCSRSASRCSSAGSCCSPSRS